MHARSRNFSSFYICNKCINAIENQCWDFVQLHPSYISQFRVDLLFTPSQENHLHPLVGAITYTNGVWSDYSFYHQIGTYYVSKQCSQK